MNLLYVNLEFNTYPNRCVYDFASVYLDFSKLVPAIMASCTTISALDTHRK